MNDLVPAMHPHAAMAMLTWFEWAEALSYVVTIIGLPLAIIVFLYEQRKERRNEEEEIAQEEASKQN